MSNNLILMTAKTARQEISKARQQDLLMMQNLAYENLCISLRRLNPELHRSLLVKSLKTILDVEGIDQLPFGDLAALFFAVLDHCSEPRALLDISNILQHFTTLLEAVYTGWIV